MTKLLPLWNRFCSFFRGRTNTPTTEQIKQKFYVEASVGLAKSSVFLVTAEDDVSRGELVSATISAYYCVFHLSSSLMWLFADQLPPTVLTQLIDIRDKGGELPSSDMSHGSVKRFLCDGQLKLINRKSLCSLFLDAKALREFANYGPRVTWKLEHPIVGPCRHSATEVKNLVPRLRPEFLSAVRLASSLTAMEGRLGLIVLYQATVLLMDPQFPFSSWSSKKIIEGALDLVEGLRKELAKK